MKTKIRTLVFKIEINSPAKSRVFDLRLPEKVKTLRSITVTTSL